MYYQRSKAFLRQLLNRSTFHDEEEFSFDVTKMDGCRPILQNGAIVYRLSASEEKATFPCVACATHCISILCYM